MSDSGTRIAAICLTLAPLATGPLGLAVAEPPAAQTGEVVPRDVRQLREAQQPDGSIRGRFNPAISTSLSLLSLALNYRFLPICER